MNAPTEERSRCLRNKIEGQILYRASIVNEKPTKYKNGFHGRSDRRASSAVRLRKHFRHPKMSNPSSTANGRWGIAHNIRIIYA